MSLHEESKVFRPFKHGWAWDVWDEHERMHWVMQEIPLGDDVTDWKNGKLNETEKSFVTQILRMFTQADVAVGQLYYNLLIPVFRNNEVRNMLGSFANREATHQRAYALLNDTLGLPEGEYSAFLDYKEMSDKYDFMLAANTDSDHGTAKTLAKGVFNEGVSLFASFVMLLNFQRRGLMKGMGKVVEWSIKDETCNDDKTEVLTNNGWKLFRDLLPTDLVAQFDMATHETSFVKPLHYTTKTYNGEMVRLFADDGWANFCVTPDHDMVIWNEFNNQTKKVKASEFRKHARIHIPTATKLAARGAGLTPHERFLIALQADGTVPPPETHRNGADSGCRGVTFSSLKKPRKIERLRWILQNCGYPFTEMPNGDKIGFYVKVPKSLLITKRFADWNVDLSKLTLEWASEFMEEVSQWDGSICDEISGRGHYGTIVEENADFVQMIGALCGWRSKITRTPDNRKESYSDYWRMSMIPGREWTRTGSLRTERVPYDGEVYCVTVPSGAIVTRRERVVGISGNCHVNGVSRLFRAFCEEHPQVVTDKLKHQIYDMAREVVRLEDAFIDLAYKLGPVEGLTPAEVKTYIRYIADRRLVQLGLKPNFMVETNPLPWLDWIISAAQHSNFFETKVAEYEAGGLTGDWAYDDPTPPVSPTYVIYGREGCPYCVKAKQLLDRLHIPYAYHDLTDNDARQAWYDANGFQGPQRSVPKIWATNERGAPVSFIGGYTELTEVLGVSVPA